MNTEEEWNSFLSSVDRKLEGDSPGGETLKVGQTLNFDMDLVNAR